MALEPHRHARPGPAVEQRRDDVGGRHHPAPGERRVDHLDVVDPGRAVRGDHVDVEWHGAAAGSGVLDGGADSLLRLQPESWGMSINTDLGVLAAARWPSNQAISGFTDFSVTSRPGLTHFSFVGSTRDENLVVDGLRKKVLFQVALGNGDDELAVAGVVRRQELKTTTRTPGSRRSPPSTGHRWSRRRGR